MKFFCEIASLTILLLIFFLCFRKKRNLAAKHSSGSIPLVSKEITMVKASDPKKMEEAEVKVEIGGTQHHRSNELVSVEDLDIGWGRWYTIWEVELATRGFAEGNVIGEGGYAVVYRGVLHDASVVDVKNLLNNKYVTFSNSPTSFFSSIFYSARIPPTIFDHLQIYSFSINI